MQDGQNKILLTKKDHSNVLFSVITGWGKILLMKFIAVQGGYSGNYICFEEIYSNNIYDVTAFFISSFLLPGFYGKHEATERCKLFIPISIQDDFTERPSQ